MTDQYVQVSTDQGGKKIDVSELTVGANTVERQRMVLADDATATGLATVTSSAGLKVNLSSGTVTSTAATNPWSSAPGFNMPMVSASSGLVQISGTPTVTSTAGTNPWSSAPGFNLPMVSVSSGLVQVSGIPTMVVSTSAGAFNAANIPMVSASSGLVQVSGTATIVSASSGLVQISGTATIVSASSGLVQISGTPTVVVATSAGSTLPITVATSAGAFAGTITDELSTGVTQGNTSIVISVSSGAIAKAVKTSAGKVYGVVAMSTGATIGFVHVYNGTTSSVTVGTSAILVVPIVVNTTVGVFSAQGFWASTRGIVCSSAISIAGVITATGNTGITGTAVVTVEYA